jgi:hypothetical protein
MIESRPEFPVKMTACCVERNDTLIKIFQESKITDNLPETLSFLATGKNYNLSANLLRTKEGKKGTISAALIIKIGSKTILDMKIDSRIGYSMQGYYFEYIQFEQKIFNHRITGYCNYSEVDPTSRDYETSFNRNSKIEMFEGNDKLGDIVLAKKSNELLDFSIRFSDNSTEPIGKYLILYEKFMNLKY